MTLRNDGITQAKAKNLRRDMTEAEKIVWRFLRDQQLKGFKFRRQQPIDHYITDFVCFENRVIIEVDGGQHHEETDKIRTLYLQQQGFHIFRFWNNDVIQNKEGVFHKINTFLNGTPPHPNPLPQGERESA